MKAVIMATGKDTRMLPLTKETLKVLIEKFIKNNLLKNRW